MTRASSKINDEAALWAVRLHAGSALSPDVQHELDTWLAADSRHEGALARARATWVDLDRLMALSAGRAQSAPRRSRISMLVTRTKLLTAIAATVLVAVVGVILIAQYPRGDSYISGVGELRRVALSDGSTMLLNTATTAKVRFEPHRRNVHLADGEALFEVAKDPQRPFVVHAGEVNVTAVGTAFVVRKRGERVDVTVTEGVVEISRTAAGSSTGGSPTRRLAAAHRAVIAEAQPVQVDEAPRAESERRLSWRTGMVSFDNDSLSDAVAELNRYNTRHIVIEDARLAARSITGIFRTTDVEGFAQTAAAALGAEVVEDNDTIRLRSR